MSLVNQMLRDLEKRRGAERRGTGALFDGLVATAEPRGSQLWLFLFFGLLLVLLAGAVGYLLWERRASVSDTSVTRVAEPPVAATVPAAVQPSTNAATVPVTPGFIALEPAPERPVQTVVLPATTPRETPRREPPRREPARGPVAPTAAPVIAEAPVVPAAPADTRVSIEKKPLPPTAQQLAAAAYQRGYEALAAGQRDEAERELREAVRQDPEHVAARESLAGLLIGAGRRVEAMDLLETGIRLKPQVASFRKLDARLRVEQEDLGGAIATLEAGAEVAARDGEYQATLAALYQRQGAYVKSMERYGQALMLEPNQGIWWVGLAISADRAGEKTAALNAYRRSIASGVSEKIAAYASERIKTLEAEAGK